MKPEGTNWRDWRYSELHREFGEDVPVTDIDTLWVEYDRQRAVAFMECKLNGNGVDDNGQAVFKNLEADTGIPVFVMNYYPANRIQNWRFRLSACGDISSGILDRFGRYDMAVSDYVEFLYFIRGREVPPAILAKFVDGG